MSLLQRITRALLAPVSAGRVLGRAVGAGSGDPTEMDAAAVNAMLATLADPVAHVSDLHDEQSRTTVFTQAVVETDAGIKGLHIPWTTLTGMWFLWGAGAYDDTAAPSTKLMRHGVAITENGTISVKSGVIDTFFDGTFLDRAFTNADWSDHLADTAVPLPGIIYPIAPASSSGTQSGRVLGFRID